MFELPPRLKYMIEVGIWPSEQHGPSMNDQWLHPTIPTDRVRLFAEEQEVIGLLPPPFPTLAQVRDGAQDGGIFWKRFGAMDQIEPDQALVIGVFDWGSDSLVILDFARDLVNPPVLRLRWVRGGVGNEWVQGARDFDEFATMLCLGLST